MAKDLPDDVEKLMEEGTTYSVMSATPAGGSVTLMYHSGPRQSLQVGSRVTLKRTW